MTSFPSSWPACGPAAHPATLLPVLDGGVDRRAWDFRMGSFPSDVTFTRASAAYYTNSDGTLTSFASGAPRIGDRGLLIEEARTNLLLRSQEFDNASWTKDGSTISANAANAPDGTATADKLVEDTSTGNHRAVQNTTNSGNTHTLTVYIEAAERTKVRLRMIWVGFCSAEYDLSDGSVSNQSSGSGGALVSATAEQMTGDIWRLILVGSVAAGDPNIASDVTLINGSGSLSYTGDGSSGAYIWGMDNQEGAFPTSYIVTEGSTVTRAADVVTITGVDSTRWFNADAFSFLWHAETLAGANANNEAATCSFEVGGNRIVVKNGSGTANFIVVDTSTQVDGNLTGTIPDGAEYKIALAVEANNFGGSLDGGAVFTDTSGTVPTVDTLDLNGITGSTNTFQGYVRRFAFYPRRLSNVELKRSTV